MSRPTIRPFTHPVSLATTCRRSKSRRQPRRGPNWWKSVAACLLREEPTSKHERLATDPVAVWRTLTWCARWSPGGVDTLARARRVKFTSALQRRPIKVGRRVTFYGSLRRSRRVRWGVGRSPANGAVNLTYRRRNVRGSRWWRPWWTAATHITNSAPAVPLPSKTRPRAKVAHTSRRTRLSIVPTARDTL